jgi:hypothetical protein
MNGDAATQIQTPLKFLGKGQWTLRGFADKPDGSDYQAVVESKQNVNAKSTIDLSLAPAGGFAAIISKANQQ